MKICVMCINKYFINFLLNFIYDENHFSYEFVFPVPCRLQYWQRVNRKIPKVVNMYDSSQPTTLSTIDTGLLIVVRLKQNEN